MTTESTQDQTAEQAQQQAAQQARPAAQAAFLAKYPLALASWFEPGKGLTLGLSPRGAQGPDSMIAKIVYEDLAIVEHDLDACLKHVRASLQSVIYSNAFGAGRASVAQEQAEAQNSQPDDEIEAALKDALADAATEVKVADSYDHPDDEIIDLSKSSVEDPEIDQ